MNQNKLTSTKLNLFNEDLSIDYITFNLKNGKNKIKLISEKFNSSYQFDSYWVDDDTEMKCKNPSVVTGKPYELCFVLHKNPSNRSTILIQFSGENARYFYNILKAEKFSWEIFNLSDLRIGRIDINYIRQNQITHNSDLLIFFERSADRYKKRYPTAHTYVITDSPTLAFATRSGDYFLRIYKTDEHLLKFELEIKKIRANQYKEHIINNSFVDFEDQICQSFYRYLRIGLVLDTDYTDWLLLKLRKTTKPENYLVSSYLKTRLGINSNSIQDINYFYRILQFLSFSRTCFFKKEILNEEVYYTVNFPLIDFAKKIGFSKDRYTHYQRRKLVDFFQQLQGLPPLITWFSDQEFRSTLIFPIVRIQNITSQHTKLIVNISVAEPFYNLNYPFCFPESFYTFQNKDDLRVKFTIIESFANQNSIRKEFPIEDFLKQFDTRNNQRRSQIKKNIIQQFQILKDFSFIENNFQFLKKDDSLINTDKLTIELINSSQVFLFYEIPK